MSGMHRVLEWGCCGYLFPSGGKLNTLIAGCGGHRLSENVFGEQCISIYIILSECQPMPYCKVFTNNVL